MSKILFIFFDGIGLAPASEANPFSAAGMPLTKEVCGADFVKGESIYETGVLFKGIDATMGVPGIPQSATGQTALLTGVNAAKLLGHHLTAYPDARLTAILSEQNILKRAQEMGRAATFANAYDLDAYNRLVSEGKIYHSATTLSVLGAKLPFRTVEDLKRGEAVYWDITGMHLITIRGADIEPISSEEAGLRLIHLLKNYDLILFECFMPDILGHHRDFDKAVSFVRLMDGLVGTCLSELNNAGTVIVTSDHGNMEDVSSGGHTLNPVPLLAFGRDAQRFNEAQSITDIAPMIMSVLES